ncbi:MAG TPA: glycine zipper domain-containing protein [Candidatus Omnitrophota bacterium]|nr:glycine zipper domain-containing protein [Candidatus Omnitrophota bacterium]
MRKMLLIFLVIALAGCATSQKTATTGGLAGATLGGIIGHQTGNGVAGAAIGGVVGTAGGMFVGDKLETKFCPVCGAVYAEDVVYCPKDGTELKERQR